MNYVGALRGKKFAGRTDSKTGSGSIAIQIAMQHHHRQEQTNAQRLGLFDLDWAYRSGLLIVSVAFVCCRAEILPLNKQRCLVAFVITFRRRTLRFLPKIPACTAANKNTSSDAPSARWLTSVTVPVKQQLGRTVDTRRFVVSLL